jgi:hypothetical protein
VKERTGVVANIRTYHPHITREEIEITKLPHNLTEKMCID